MTQEETLKRIERDADMYAMNHSAAPDKETPDWIKTDFIVGAKSWRNKTTDEVIELLVWHIDNGEIIDESFVRKELSPLKVDL